MYQLVKVITCEITNQASLNSVCAFFINFNETVHIYSLRGSYMCQTNHFKRAYYAPGSALVCFKPFSVQSLFLLFPLHRFSQAFGLCSLKHIGSWFVIFVFCLCRLRPSGRFNGNARCFQTLEGRGFSPRALVVSLPLFSTQGHSLQYYLLSS